MKPHIRRKQDNRKLRLLALVESMSAPLVCVDCRKVTVEWSSAHRGKCVCCGCTVERHARQKKKAGETSPACPQSVTR